MDVSLHVYMYMYIFMYMNLVNVNVHMHVKVLFLLSFIYHMSYSISLFSGFQLNLLTIIVPLDKEY